jgi:hypothetical protein
MLQLENLPSLARKYKGAPLACLWVLITTNQRVTQSYLQSMTGYTDKTISSALEFLKEDGLIDHQYNGWLLCEDVQLPLTNPSQIIQGRRNSDPIISSESINNIDDVLTTNNRKCKNSDIWKILEGVGVYHNSVTDVLADKLTQREVLVAIRQLGLENKTFPKDAGLLISRLKNPIKYNSSEDIDREKRSRYSDWEKKCQT